RCAGCHSSAPTTPGIPAAPLGVRHDTPDEIRANAPRILAVAVDAQTMPLGNGTGMTAEERDVVGRWIRAGAPLRYRHDGTASPPLSPEVSEVVIQPAR